MASTQDLDLTTEACLANGMVDESLHAVNSCHFPTSSRPRKETDHLEAIKIFDRASPVSAVEKIFQTPELMMVSWAVLLKAYTLSGPVSFIMLDRADTKSNQAKEEAVGAAGRASVLEYQVWYRTSPKVVQLRTQQPLTRDIIERAHINTAVHISASKLANLSGDEPVRLPYLQQGDLKHQVR